MPRIRYRTKLRLRKIGRLLLLALLFCLVGLIAAIAYADSLVHYDRDGAQLLNRETLPPVTQAEAAPRPTIIDPTIVLEEKELAAASIAELGGVYITTSMLRDIEQTTALVKEIREPCAVMIELKSIFGNFYYSSEYANGNVADAGISDIMSLIDYLNDNGFYTIASLPAFRDSAYALDNQSLGLPTSGGVLWMDDKGCYWLDPSNDAVISHLMQLARELGNMGFQEVAFSEFCFPDTDSISYASDLSRAEVIEEAAEELSGFFVGSELTLSFVSSRTDFPVGGGRLYVPNVDGSQVERYASAYADSEGLAELVFLASSRDTRFEGHGILRPLMAE